MIDIYEKNSRFGLAYEKYDNQKLRSIVKVTKIVRDVDNKKYFLLLDTWGNTITEAFYYLNDQLKKKDFSVRELAATALKLLFSYTSLFNINDYRCFTASDVDGLKTFLEGGTLSGNVLESEFDTVRKETTINMYLGVYRDFFSYLKIKENVFSEKICLPHEKGNSSFRMSSKKSSYIFKVNYRTFRNDVYNKVPKYIKIEEYIKINRFIKNSSSKFIKRNLILVKLMFEYGLRIGEVLGITIEDFRVFRNGDKITATIELRNRLSDSKYQKCKTLMKVNSINDYKSYYYTKEKVGFYRIYIEDIELINLINSYYTDTRGTFSSKAVNNLLSGCEADKVTDRQDIRINQYLLISKNFKKLSISGWNKCLRNIFSSVGIEVDKNTKSNNLNHRLRHGFSMFLINYAKFDSYELKNALRHGSIHSGEVYNNPDTDESIELFNKCRKFMAKYLGENSDEEKEI